MAIPTYVNVGAIVSDVSGGASTTPTPPAHVADDILIAVSWNEAFTTMVTATGGWTKINEAGVSGSNTLALFWARATGSGTAGPVITSASTDQWAFVFAIRGCITTGTPYEGGTFATALSTTTPQTASTITTGADRLVVSVLGHDTNNGFASGNPPAGWNIMFNLTDAAGTLAGFNAINKGEAAATTTAAATIGTLSTAQQWRSFTFAFIPPAVAVPPPPPRTFQPFLAQ